MMQSPVQHQHQHGMMAPPAAASRAMAAVAKSNERIYSGKQLAEALRSGLSSVREQLSVLSILDGTALSWPGVAQAVDDVEFLVDVTSQTVARMEQSSQRLEGDLLEVTREAGTLRETLAMTQRAKDELASELKRSKDDSAKQLITAQRETKSTAHKLEGTNRELQTLKQDNWALEKARADLASELDKVKADRDFMEAELTTLRNQAAEATAQATGLKEELAARRADVGHLTKRLEEHKAQGDTARRQLAAAQQGLQQSQAEAMHLRGERDHYGKEAERLHEEASRLARELDGASKEVRRLREWGEVLKKVEADKLREEQERGHKAQAEADARAAELDKQVASLAADVTARDEKLLWAKMEVESVGKQVSLLQLQLKDLNKQLDTVTQERQAVAKERDEAKAQTAKLQGAMHQLSLKMSQQEKDRAVAEGRVKELHTEEKSKLQAQLDEALKEMAVHKALAEGWQRDMRALHAKLKSETARANSLAAQLQAMESSVREGQAGTAAALNMAEQQVKDLKAQVDVRELELRRVKYDAASQAKAMEKLLERVQRENDACASEIERLRLGQPGSSMNGMLSKLPMVQRPITLQDDLANLKRLVTHIGPPGPNQGFLPMAAGGGGGSLPLPQGTMGPSGVSSLPALPLSASRMASLMDRQRPIRVNTS